jgi:hypothetical protein
MNDTFHTGEWHLPSSNLKLPGRLIFDDTNKSICLEIFGDRYLEDVPVTLPNNDKRYRSKRYNDNYLDFHNVINGTGAGYFTLYNCRWSGTQEIGAGLYQIKYLVEFVFFGVQISSMQERLVQSATFMFSHMGSWYDGRQSTTKMDKFDGTAFSFSETSSNEAGKAGLKVKPGLTLTFYDDYKKLLKEIGIHHEIKYRKLVKFEYDVPVVFDDMMKDLRIFSSLLQFALGKSLKKMLLSVDLTKEHILQPQEGFFEGISQRVPVGNLSLHKGTGIKNHSMHQNYMLVSRWNMDVEAIQSLIKKWYDNERFYPLYDLYIDSNNWFQDTNATLSNVMFNNKFLNIIQGIESYYHKVLITPLYNDEQIKKEKEVFNDARQKIFNKIKGADSDLATWLNCHLNYKSPPRRKPKSEIILANVIESFKDILDPLFGHNEIISFFPRFASKIRDELSHALHDKTAQGKVMHPFFQFGQILLAICILKTLEVSNITDKVAKYDTFRDYIYEIKRSTLKFVN